MRWMASLTQWTWVWASSGSWWWTGKPGVLQSMGSQRVGHNWVTELNWTDTCKRGKASRFTVLFWGGWRNCSSQVLNEWFKLCNWQIPGPFHCFSCYIPALPSRVCKSWCSRLSGWAWMSQFISCWRKMQEDLTIWPISQEFITILNLYITYIYSTYIKSKSKGN